MNARTFRQKQDEAEYLQTLLASYVRGLGVIAAGYGRNGQTASAERIVEAAGLLESLLPARNA